MNRSPRDKYFVFIDSWTNEDLVMFSRIEQCRTGPRVRFAVHSVDDQGFSAVWIRRRISHHVQFPSPLPLPIFLSTSPHLSSTRRNALFRPRASKSSSLQTVYWSHLAGAWSHLSSG